METIAPDSPYTASERFTRVMDVLREVIAREGKQRGISAVWLALIWARLRRFAVRIARLDEWVRVGKPERTVTPRAVEAPEAEPLEVEPPPVRPRTALPQQRGWLVRLIPEVEWVRGTMHVLLKKPEFVALISEAPQVGRILRPLCLMLNIDVPSALRLPRSAWAWRAMIASESAAARAWREGGGGWPRWRGRGALWRKEDVSWEFLFAKYV